MSSPVVAAPVAPPAQVRALTSSPAVVLLAHRSLEGSSNQQAAEQVYNAPADHQSSFGHEAIAGAAVSLALLRTRASRFAVLTPSPVGRSLPLRQSFAAVRAYEQHCAQNGKPQSHALALEILAGFAGAEADKLIETKGLNEVDAIKAKRAAKAQAAEALHQSGQFQDEEGYSRHGDYPEERYQGGSGVGDRHWGNDEREVRPAAIFPFPFVRVLTSDIAVYSTSATSTTARDLLLPPSRAAAADADLGKRAVARATAGAAARSRGAATTADATRRSP